MGDQRLLVYTRSLPEPEESRLGWTSQDSRSRGFGSLGCDNWGNSAEDPNFQNVGAWVRVPTPRLAVRLQAIGLDLSVPQFPRP